MVSIRMDSAFLLGLVQYFDDFGEFHFVLVRDDNDIDEAIVDARERIDYHAPSCVLTIHEHHEYGLYITFLVNHDGHIINDYLLSLILSLRKSPFMQ